MRTHRSTRKLALVLVAGVVTTAACSFGASSTGTTGSAPSSASAAPTTYKVNFSTELVAQAKAAATAAVGDQKLSGKVEIAGLNGGFEEAIMQSALKVFSDTTGVQIEYTGGSSVETRIQARVQAGNPPDIAQEGGLWNLQRYAAQGKVTPVSDVIDTATLQKSFDPGVLAGMTIDGKVYSVPVVTNPQEVWYNPQTYTQPAPATWDDLVAQTNSLVSGGKTPWCMGLQSFSPAAYFIEDIYAKTYGAAALDAWAKGETKWTSDQVKDAFTKFGQIASEKNVYGGLQGVLSTGSSAAAGLLYQQPEKCSLLHWGSYTGGIVLNQYPQLNTDSQIKFFDLPAATSKYSKDEQVSGWTMYMFNDRPEVRAVIKYLASAGFQALLANGGSWVAANKDVPLSAYPNAFSKATAGQVKNANAIAFGPMFQTLTPVFQAFQDGIGKYLDNPGSLDDVLSGIQDVVDSNS